MNPWLPHLFDHKTHPYIKNGSLLSRRKNKGFKVSGAYLKIRVTLINVFDRQTNVFIKRYTSEKTLSYEKKLINFPEGDNWLISCTKENVSRTL